MAFCGKCGAEVYDGDKFCTSCGAPIGRESSRIFTTVQSTQGEGSLLYETQGGQHSKIISSTIEGIAVGIATVFCLVATFTMHVIFASAGLLPLLFTISYLKTAYDLKKCWIKIYSDHIEARTICSGFKKNIIYLFYDQIDYVRIEKHAIVLEIGGAEIRIACEKLAYVFFLIRGLINSKTNHI